MTEKPKWTDKAIVYLTVAIVLLAFVQYLEMRGAGEQTDKLVTAAQIQAKAAERNVIAAESFAGSGAKAVAELKRSADDSEKAINIASHNAQQALRVTQRPYLTVKNIRFDPDLAASHSPAFIKLDMFNSGRSPALNEEDDLSAYVDDERIRITQPPAMGETVVASDTSVGNEISLMLSDKTFERITRGQARLSVKGKLTYSDIFHDRHETQVCAWWDFSKNSWKFCALNRIR